MHTRAVFYNACIFFASTYKAEASEQHGVPKYIAQLPDDMCSDQIRTRLAEELSLKGKVHKYKEPAAFTVYVLSLAERYYSSQTTEMFEFYRLWKKAQTILSFSMPATVILPLFFTVKEPSQSPDERSNNQINNSAKESFKSRVDEFRVRAYSGTVDTSNFPEPNGIALSDGTSNNASSTQVVHTTEYTSHPWNQSVGNLFNVDAAIVLIQPSNGQPSEIGASNKVIKF